MSFDVLLVKLCASMLSYWTGLDPKSAYHKANLAAKEYDMMLLIWLAFM